MVKSRINGILDTYGAASRGEPLRPGDDSRIKKIAYRLGGLTNQRIERENAILDGIKMRQLNEAVAAAEGLNYQSLTILRSACAIPNQGASYPGWGVVRLRQSGRVFGAPPQPGDGVTWTNSFSFGESIDPSRSYTPLIGEAPILTVDNTAWSHNALRIPVRNIHITSDAAFEHNMKLAGASTLIHINSTEYKPDSLDLDGSDGYTGSARFEISSDGRITSAQFGREYSTGYISEEDSAAMSIGLSELFDSVQLYVDLTAEAYSESL